MKNVLWDADFWQPYLVQGKFSALSIVAIHPRALHFGLVTKFIFVSFSFLGGQNNKYLEV